MRKLVVGAFPREHSPLGDLPSGLRVSGDLDVSGTGITALPEGLSVGGSLYIGRTGITALPEGLTVGRHLYSSHTRLTALPGGLRVGGSLFVSHTGLTALPDDLSVGGPLYCRYVHRRIAGGHKWQQASGDERRADERVEVPSGILQKPLGRDAVHRPRLGD